jgi:CDP-6-deoxy-D-xylo-4-hexulose-3-dehydrase
VPIGPRLRGTPTGQRSTLTVTSFANSHIMTCGGSGGMLLVDDDALRDRAVMLRRWGRRSELHFFGSKRKDRDFWEDLDGIEYDNQFIFDELAWNFEPSEMGAAFGLEQLKKLDDNLARRRRTFDRYTDFFAQHADRFVRPRQLADLETAWLGYPLLITDDAGFDRPDMQRFLDDTGVETRTIWTGNVARQPMLRGRELVLPEDGLPNADNVMRRGVLLPLSHAIDDETLDFVFAQVDAFVESVS